MPFENGCTDFMCSSLLCTLMYHYAGQRREPGRPKLSVFWEIDNWSARWVYAYRMSLNACNLCRPESNLCNDEPEGLINQDAALLRRHHRRKGTMFYLSIPLPPVRLASRQMDADAASQGLHERSSRYPEMFPSSWL